MDTSLIVPMALDILMAPNVLFNRDQLRWWRFNYANLNNFQSPQPRGYDSEIKNIRSGTYLHWTLPRSLRMSKDSDNTEFPLVPNRWLIVRIHRDAGGNNVQRSWVLESDCPSSTLDNSSLFLVPKNVVKKWSESSDPNRKNSPHKAISLGYPISADTNTDSGVYTVNLGVPIALNRWKEKSPDNMFLTAIAPGNIEYAGYVPNNLGIFSFYDDLSDVPAQTTLSYLVTGWYADKACDILTTGSNGFTGESSISDVLKKLNWTIAQGKNPGTANKSLYNGMAFGLPWNKSSIPIPDQLEDIRNTNNVTVAIGNTGVDAFTTLVSEQLNKLLGYSNKDKMTELLKAFQYDLLPELNKINGNTIVANRVQREWFDERSGGTLYKIVRKSNADTRESRTSGDGSITPNDKKWLLELNANQKNLDSEILKLNNLQWDLNAAWWKLGNLSSRNNENEKKKKKNTEVSKDEMAPTLSQKEFEEFLDKVLQQLDKIHKLQGKVPQPDNSGNDNAQDAFLKGIEKFAKQKGIANGFELKAVSAPRFWKPGNPGLLISGVESDAITNSNNNLEVRLPSQIISSFKISYKTIDVSTLGNIIPTLPNSTVLPKEILKIYKEFFLLDPANAKQIASKTGLTTNVVESAMLNPKPLNYSPGVLPACSLSKWTQKWNPLYLEWEITPLTVPYEWKKNSTTTKNWNFNGFDYDLKSSPQGTSESASLKGRSILSPHTQFTFGAKLKAFVDQYGPENEDLTAIYNQIKDIDNWRFLSQELSEVNEYLSQRDPRAFRRPTIETFKAGKDNIRLAKAIGYADNTSSPPYDTPTYAQGFVNSVPAISTSHKSQFPFHGIRSGQYYIKKLRLYDKFGRTLDLIVDVSGAINSASHFPVVLDNAVKISENLVPHIKAPFQLPPRLLQHAKLDISLIDHVKNNITPEANPICGWLIHNYLDRSILVFLPDGTSAGELLLVQPGIVKTVNWVPPPNDNGITIDSIKAKSEQLYAFIIGLKGKSERDFKALLSVIDITLSKIDPPGNRTDLILSTLIGRPLALVRTKLQFLLRESPLQSCEWPKFMEATPQIPPFTSSNFSIRLGEMRLSEDGVIGYFDADNYKVFNSVTTPESGQNYVREIGPIGSVDGNYINLPFDGTTSKIITLLMDPRGSIHATTGILPVKSIQIPIQFVNGPLTAMEINFRVGPILSRVLDTSVEEGVTPPFVQTINYLPISEKNGSWSWWQNSNSGSNNKWQGYSLANAPNEAVLNKAPATLHDGYLRFITDPESK
ncbi:hypothetical protein DVR12_19675 [Chitinophaga silvatica]|uniref:Uncharacterized protein n=1 Tax=Chitinophaga silvatica TaxID=2282649 RepID=A0A3E1Y5F8_9BACT|nr:hypothetical protein [Chitinophaga silvatica]RFS19952.1 hypothetical protein DVR12_19675 [Chitinophaga silvatica]